MAPMHAMSAARGTANRPQLNASELRGRCAADLAVPGFPGAQPELNRHETF
jgi:hypothetical protein